METHKFEEENKNADGDCPVCMSLMIEPTKLNCGHRFCIQCMDEVLKTNEKCPMCR